MFTDEEMATAIVLAYDAGGRKAFWCGLGVGLIGGLVLATILYMYILGL